MRATFNALMVLVVAAMLAACTSISSSGPVVRVPNDDANDQSTIRYSPAGPSLNAAPEAIVRGYVDAMLAYPASARTVASFLTRQAAASWNPAGRMIEYSSLRVNERQVDSSAVADPAERQQRTYLVPITVSVQASVSERGEYKARQAQDEIVFRLVEEDGQWRISNPVDAMLVNNKFVRDYVRVYNTYFFDRRGERLIATPVHAVVGEQLATTLMTSLVRGVPAGLRTDARTYVPTAAVLRPSVPVSANGVADVEFTAALGTLSAGARDRLSAQVVWTLKQVPGVRAVRIMGDDTALVNGRTGVQSVNAWGGYGPSLKGERAFAVHDGKVVQLLKGKMTPVDGPFGRDANGAVALAVSGGSVAATLVSRALVRVSDADSKGIAEIEGSGIIATLFDDSHALWIVDGPPRGTRIRLRSPERTSTLDTSVLNGMVVHSFDLSPDEARYVIAGRKGGRERFWVGMVTRDSLGNPIGLGRPRVLPAPGVNPREVSWSSPTSLAYVVDAGEGQVVRQVRIDGSLIDESGDLGLSFPARTDITALVAGRSAQPDMYATDARGRLWFKPFGDVWRIVSTSKVTALGRAG